MHPKTPNEKVLYPSPFGKLPLDRTWRDLCKENSNNCNSQDIATKMKEMAQNCNLISRPVGFTRQKYLISFDMMKIRKKMDTTHRGNAM